jgi:hypothetical protein
MSGDLMSPKTFADILPGLRQVAYDADLRAATLREYVILLEKGVEDGLDFDAQVGDQHAGPGYVKDLLERVDAACHIHSGSSEASNVRMLTTGVFSLLGHLQRKSAKREAEGCSDCRDESCSR